MPAGRPLRRRARRLLTGLLLLGLGRSGAEAMEPAAAPSASQCRTIDESAGYTIRSLSIDGRWVPSLDRLGIANPVGQPYSPLVVSDAETKVDTYLRSQPNRRLADTVVGSYEVLYVGSCVHADDGAKLVDIVIIPAYVRVDRVRIERNTLPIPRAGTASFLDAVPSPLLGLHPSFGVTDDRRAGVAAGASISTNLLDLPALLAGAAPAKRPTRLDLQAGGSASFDTPFYDSNLRLTLSRADREQPLDALSLTGGFSAAERPLGPGRNEREAADLAGSATVRPGLRWLDKGTLGAGYRWSRNFTEDTARRASELTTENALDLRLVADGRPAGGFARIGIWGDAAAPSGPREWYQRVATVVGYARELGASHQTVGIETIVGGGYAWGSVPEYARFFGGSAARNYLYEAHDAPALTGLPAGPLLRSVGESQARNPVTGRGGTAYWHVNFNVALPFPPWSRPLIPDVPITIGRRTTTLRDGLKTFAITSATSAIADDQSESIIEELKKRGMSEDDATARADEIAAERAKKIVDRDIRPTVEFISDRANLVAVKPLLLLDAGAVDPERFLDHRTRYAIGGGIQVTIVIAKLELAYVHALRRLPGDPHGQILFRVVFDNFF